MALIFTPGSKPITKPNGPTTPAGKNPADKPGTPEKKDPQLESLQRQQEQLSKRIEQRTKALAPKKALSDHIRSIALAADDPNDDPSGLYMGIRPTLSKMGLANIVERSATEIDPISIGPGKMRQFKVMVRRNEKITKDTIDRIKRQEANYDYLIWTDKGICVYIWDQYEPTVGGV